MGETALSEQLREASLKLTEATQKSRQGNGAGMTLLSGAVSAFQALAPLAIKAFTPMPF